MRDVSRRDRRESPPRVRGRVDERADHEGQRTANLNFPMFLCFSKSVAQAIHPEKSEASADLGSDRKQRNGDG